MIGKFETPSKTTESQSCNSHTHSSQMGTIDAKEILRDPSKTTQAVAVSSSISQPAVQNMLPCLFVKLLLPLPGSARKLFAAASIFSMLLVLSFTHTALALSQNDCSSSSSQQCIETNEVASMLPSLTLSQDVCLDDQITCDSEGFIT